MTSRGKLSSTEHKVSIIAMVGFEEYTTTISETGVIAQERLRDDSSPWSFLDAVEESNAMQFADDGSIDLGGDDMFLDAQQHFQSFHRFEDIVGSDMLGKSFHGLSLDQPDLDDISLPPNNGPESPPSVVSSSDDSSIESGDDHIEKNPDVEFAKEAGKGVATQGIAGWGIPILAGWIMNIFKKSDDDPTVPVGQGSGANAAGSVGNNQMAMPSLASGHQAAQGSTQQVMGSMTKQ